MRSVVFLFTLVLVTAFAHVTEADDHLHDEFKTRIESALRESDEQRKRQAIRALFYRQGLDEKTTGIMDRVVQRLAKTHRRHVAFAPLPDDATFVHILDGYEYRPNLEPVGYVVLTSPEDPPGNDTKIPYGRHPESGRYAFPSTIRTLVNPDAEPDKQLQIIAVGIAHPPMEFEGWCDIALSNGTTRRITLEDQGVGNQTRILRGQEIEACELTNRSNEGSLSLKLIQDGDTIFDRRIQPPETTITYRP